VARQAAGETRGYGELALAPHWEATKAALDAEAGRRASRIRSSAAFQLPA